MEDKWYAIDTLDEAYDQTKEFLFPFDAGTWLKLAVIVFFIGSSYSPFFPGFGDTGTDMDNVEQELPNEFTADIQELATNPVVLTIAALLMLLILLFSYVSAVFEFIFYQSLHDNTITIRNDFAHHARNGFKYFIFNWAILLAGFIGAALIIGAGMTDIRLGALTALLVLPIWLLLWLTSFYVKNMTLPEMVINNTEFIPAMKQSYHYVRTAWKQAGLFLLTKFILGIAAGIVTGTLAVIGVIILAIPLAILGIILYTIQPILVAIPLTIGIIGLITVFFAASIPVQTYIYQWVLNVYTRF